MKLIKTFLLLACSALLAGPVYGDTDQDEDKSYSGRINIGVMLINSSNNLNPNGSKKYIEDLESAPDKERTVMPVIMPTVSYRFESLKLYLDTKAPIDEVGGFAINLGGTYPLGDVGILDSSIFVNPFEEAWKNPYQTGVNRSSTSTSKYGLKVGLNKIMGTGLRVNAVYMNDTVDDDVIGELRPEMERDGSVYALNMNYSFYLSETLEIRPRISVRKGEYSGEVNSFIKYKTELEARYRIGRLMLMPRVYYSFSEYDERNPIFNKTREDNGYGGNLMVNYIAPLGFRDWSAQLLLAYSKGDSNINFYDTEGITTGMFMSYAF